MSAQQSKTLEDLRELVRIVSNYGPQLQPIVSSKILDKSTHLYAKLYRAIRDNPKISDFETLHGLAEQRPESNRKTGSGFLKLKSRLRVTLTNSLFFLDLERGNFSEYARTLYSVMRSVFIARVLVALNARGFALSIARDGLGKAIAIEDWASAMEFLFVLRGGVSQAGDRRTHDIYVREYLHCQKLMIALHEAEIAMERLQLAFVASGGEKPEHAELAAEAAARAETLSAELPSFRLSFIAIRLRAIEFQIRMDYKATIDLCKRAFALLDRYPNFSNRARRAEYAIMKLVSAVQLNDDLVAKEAIDQCARDLNDQENNWFTFKEFEFLYFMHHLRFDEADTVLQHVIGHHRYYTLTDSAREKWEIFRLYLLLVKGEEIAVEIPSDFSTLVPTYLNDKPGLNMAIILLHIMLLADRKLFADVRDRAEFIKGYRKRFLRGPQNSHASHFFAMLGIIETCDLNYKKIIRRTSKMVIELNRMEREEPIQGELILPYSWIWERLMNRLSEYRPLAHKE